MFIRFCIAVNLGVTIANKFLGKCSATRWPSVTTFNTDEICVKTATKITNLMIKFIKMQLTNKSLDSA